MEVRFVWVILLVLACTATTAPLSASTSPNVLIVYANDQNDQTKSLADSIAQGALRVVSSSSVKVLEVSGANYKRDVFEWADAVILGSGVYNGNAAPELLSFINSFDFMDDLSQKLGASFATGGAPTGGLQPVLEQINRGLSVFRFMIAGGNNWKNGEGTGVVTSGSNPIAAPDAELAVEEGSRIASIAQTLWLGRQAAGGGNSSNTSASSPPGFGESWSGAVSANLTQVGYDAGLVIVNFTTQCGADPGKQRMKTVYGDFYTVLTRCDLGLEFTIAPASRGGGCQSRTIGVDVGDRICKACGCPFCVRDTNGTFSHGVASGSTTVWGEMEKRTIQGVSAEVYSGRAQSTSVGRSFDLETTIAYVNGQPRWVNVTHPLWVQTAAQIDDFTTEISSDAFDIPKGCFKQN